MNKQMARILCVDDEPPNLSLLEAILAPRGYEVVAAVNAAEALEKIRSERIDICLLDVMMPGMDGFEVCRRIKADEQHRNVPVVMITSFAGLENRIRGIEAGAEDFISKPFDSAEVLARIKMLLHVKSLNDRLQSAHHEAEETLRYCSTHDILTGLYNRAFFDEELERLTQSRMFPVSIVMADINGLKTVNDTLGHAAGDGLIQLAGRIILEAFRGEDIVARIGGDEFAVLLPGVDRDVAEEAVRRITRCPEIISRQASIALGVASAENRDQLAEALKLSDERMYQDKSAQKDLLVRVPV
jgi:diguanylate cyclase (GGDEF)-like protein